MCVVAYHSDHINYSRVGVDLLLAINADIMVTFQMATHKRHNRYLHPS